MPFWLSPFLQMRRRKLLKPSTIRVSRIAGATFDAELARRVESVTVTFERDGVPLHSFSDPVKINFEAGDSLDLHQRVTMTDQNGRIIYDEDCVLLPSKYRWFREVGEK